MKVKKIMMTILLAVGFIAAKAATGYPPELVLVSQPVMTYNDYSNSITVYYDVQNIGDYRYKGYVYIYLDPDDGYYYAREWVKVCPGKIKRIAIDIPAYRPNPSYTYTIMPYYELGDELYSFTTFEYFEPLAFRWNGPRTERWVVINVGPRPRYYVRPGDYRYYYDGYRPPMPPPPVAGYGPGPMPPMDPHHHTYIYHYNNGGYPGAHYYYDDHGNATPIDHNSQATVRPHNNGTAGSMSSNGAGFNNQNNFNGSGNNGATTRPNSGSSNVSSESTSRPSSGSNNNGATTRPNSGSSNVGRTSNSSSSNSGTSARPSSGNSSSNRSGSNSSSSSRASSSSSSNNRSSGTSSSSSSSRTSSSSSSSRSGSSSSGARR